EYKDYSPQKTSIFFSCLWGVGYIILTGFYVLSSVIKTYIGKGAALGFIS
ncbi:MFS transporter, partial [Microbacterium esteraromaticum]